MPPLPTSFLRESSNITVAVRVRPFIGPENSPGLRPLFYANEAKRSIRIIGSEKSWIFDHVFDPKAKQRHVYETCVHGLVEDVVGG